MIPEWSPTKAVVWIGFTSRSWGQKIGFLYSIFKNLNLNSQGPDLLYFVYNEVKTGPTLGVTIFIELLWKICKWLFLSCLTPFNKNDRYTWLDNYVKGTQVGYSGPRGHSWILLIFFFNFLFCLSLNFFNFGALLVITGYDVSFMKVYRYFVILGCHMVVVLLLLQ